MKEKLEYFTAKMAEVRKADMEHRKLVGDFDDEFRAWLKELGLPDNFHLLDVIAKVSELE